MSKDMLRTVLETKEASTLGALRGSIKRALGAGAASGGTLASLEAAGLENQPLLWGLVGGAGVLGHDVAGALASRRGFGKHLEKVSCARRDKKILLQKLGKCSKGRKKRAAMEKPFKQEYSLTKQASLLSRLGYLGTEVAPIVAGAHYGGKMGRHLLPDNPLIGTLLGGLGMSTALSGATSGLGKALFPKGHKYFKGVQNKQLAKYSSTTKQAGLSRAAKGAIALPAAALALGPVAAATHMPYVADDMISQLAKTKGNLEGASGLFKALYGPLRVPSALGIGDPQILAGYPLQRAAQSLAGLSALGAGAGKLSEKVIPVAKKSFIEDPKNRKLMLAASLFPWITTATGATYLANKALNSDS